jgi:Fe-S cluster assembly protein SufD
MTMAEVKKITRIKRGETIERKDFPFTQEMIPIWGENQVIQDYRLKAWENYINLSLPTIRDEAWRRTNLQNFNPGAFSLPSNGYLTGLSPIPAELLQPVTADIHGGQIVMLPGKTEISLDPALKTKGVIFTDLENAEKKYPDLLQKIMGKIVKSDESKFAAMVGALSRSGVLLYVPRGIEVEQPLHSLIWGPGLGLAFFSHIMVYLEEGASATYVHEQASPTETGGQSLHSQIVEIYVGDSANLRLVELQSWGQHVWNFGHERVHVERDGNLEWIFGVIGSHLTKNFSELDLIGSGSSGKMSGFYFTNHDQHLDQDTQQNHLAPHTTSDLLFKGALLDASRPIWQGMIYVAPHASKTDGYQANRNLVLSSKARADSIPGLEILTDDVRCTHGATVGKIDPEQIFYLLSRGIPMPEAERLIVEGFFDPIMQRIPFEKVRGRFERAIHEKMESYDPIGG